MKENKQLGVILFTHYAELYGANRSLLNLIEGLLEYKDLKVYLIAPMEGALTRKARELGISLEVMPFLNEVELGPAKRRTAWPKKIVKFAYNWYIVWRYASAIRKRGPLVIHSNSSATFIGAYFAYWLKVPHVWHLREFGWIDCRMTYDFGEKYFRFWLNKAQAAIGISRSVFESRVLPSSVERKRLIYNGVSHMKDLMPMNGKRVMVKDTVFAIIGWIMETKNQMEAIESFILLKRVRPDVRLVIVGEGDPNYVAQIRKAIKDNGIEDMVSLTGFVDKMDEIYPSIDYLLMCSKNEALGRVTIEAMSYGIPVIGYNNGGTKEIIRDGYNGLLYSKGPQELYEKMLFVMDNPDYLKSIQQNCIDTVKQNFSIEQYAEKLRNLYMECSNHTGA